MKAFKIFLIILTTIISLKAYPQEVEKFNSGVEGYSAGNYKEALDSWIDLYDAGYRSANLNYNIGNAYFKMGDIPSAILFYERAYLLKPADENINYNLNIARSLTVDRFNEIPELFFLKWFNFVSLLLRSNTWSIISIVSFIFCLLSASLYIYSSKYGMKVTGFWVGILMLIVSVATLSFSLQNRTLVFDSHKAIIFTPQISGKSSPDTSGTDLFVIHEGTRVTVGEAIGGWFEITLSDGNKGWVPASSLNII